MPPSFGGYSTYRDVQYDMHVHWYPWAKLSFGDLPWHVEQHVSTSKCFMLFSATVFLPRICPQLFPNYLDLAAMW